MRTWAAASGARLALVASLATSLATAFTTELALAEPTPAERLRAELGATEPARRQAAARELAVLDPTSALPLVRRALDDLDLEVRVAATGAVGQLALVDLAPLLLERATAADARLREATVDALGRLATDVDTTRRIDATLGRALGDPEASVRVAALRTLADRPLAAAQRAGLVQAIASSLGDERPELRRLAAETLEHLADPFALHALAARVDDPSPEVRLAVGRALGALGDARAAPAVLRLLEDSAEEVRATAVTTLGSMAAETAVTQLAPMLLRPHDPLAGPSAVALGRITGAVRKEDATAKVLRARAGETLVAAIQGGINRAAALEGIHVSGIAAARLLAPLLPPLGLRPADDLLLLAGELAAAGDEPTTALLLELSRLSSDARFEAALMRAQPPVGATRDTLVAWLAARLADPGVAARRAAAGALGVLADPRAARPLEAAIADSDAEVRRAALLALARSSSASLEHLLGAARGADLELARAALAALARRRDEPSRNALVAALRGADPIARRTAALGLSDDPGATSAIAPLTALLRSSEGAAREAATLALLGPLRRRSDAAVRELCLSLLAGDADGAAGGLELLGAMRDPASAARLLAQLPRLGKRAVRRGRLYAVLGALLLAADDASIERALVAALEDPDTSARASAAWALGKARARGPKDDPIDRALVAHLADSNGAVRANSLAALARRGRVVAPPLLARLAHDPEVAARANAARLGASLPAAARLGDEPGAIQRAELAARRKQPIAARGGSDYALLRLLDAPGAALAARVTLPDGLTVVLLADEDGIVHDEGLPAGELLVAPTSGR